MHSHDWNTTLAMIAATFALQACAPSAHAPTPKASKVAAPHTNDPAPETVNPEPFPKQFPKIPAPVPRATIAEEEVCDLNSTRAQGTDTNNDGRPDVIRAELPNLRLCRTTDLDFDGRPEIREFYVGNRRRREVDMDMDGQPETIEIFENGQLLEKAFRSSPSGRIDHWEMLADGKVVQTAWDRNGDGRVDEWRVHGSPGDPDSGTAYTDADGDGFADTRSPAKVPK